MGNGIQIGHRPTQADVRNIVFQNIDGEAQDGAEIARGQTNIAKLAKIVIASRFEEITKIVQIDLTAGTMKDISADVAGEIGWASYQSWEPLADNLREFLESFGFVHYGRSTDVGAYRSDERRNRAA